MSRTDEYFMRAALREARRALGRTSPNPTVGAVLVVNDKIVAKGHHREAGAPHAEIACLRAFGRDVPPNATLFVTLEPCSTTGRTPPCFEEIVKAKVNNVVIGAVDLNPRHAGRGLALLQKAGINVRSGVLAEECAALNEAFNKWIVTREPFVIVKCGMSLNGRITRPPGEPSWITSAVARRHARQLRTEVDAVLVGAETIRADNPRLTVRGFRGAKQPWRVVLSRSGILPEKANVFADRFSQRTLVYRDQPLAAVLRDLGKKNILSVLIEGGGEVLGQALDEKLFDKLVLYLGPILTGGPVLAYPGQGVAATSDAVRLQRPAYGRIDNTICVTGYPIYPSERSAE